MNEASKQVSNLVDRFQNNLDAYRSPAYNETQLRIEFIDPFFEALGWDVANKAGYAEQYKDVIHEDAIKVSGATKAPDYCFRIGGVRKFFLETKKPSIDIKDQVGPAYQLRRYAWSAKLPLSILTNFAELAIYDCRIRPKPGDKASIGRVRLYPCTEYIKSIEEIYNLFSKESVLKGSFDKFAETDRLKRGTTEVDSEFLKEIEYWREILAKDMARRNPKLSVHDLNYAVQLTIDRIIFLRMCEDRGIESYGQIQSLLNGTNTYHRLTELFYHADGKYNSGLFDFKSDRLTPQLKIDDPPLKDIFKNLYYPDSPYEFSVLGADILGHVYEQFLGKVIRLTGGHQAKVEEKPEVRKAGGIYYTPTYIVDYIVKNTVGKLCEGKRPRQISLLRILDPACGSGSFLLGAYQYLLDYHRDWYQKDGSGKHTKEIYQGRGGQWYLTIQEKKRVLLNNIYGVDIDQQAVEVTKLSLLLKVLEGENQDTLEKQMKLFKERALPNLESNIKWGNSLIGPESSQGIQLNLLDPDEIYRINRFDWEKEFPQILKQGGFDAVIGNPPYIRIQTLKDSAPLEIEFYKDYYSAASKGNYDIYVVFIERGLSLLNPEGSLGFIVPHKFFTAKYGEPIRNLVAKGMYLAEVVHFGDRQIFTGASTYTCLLFLNKTGSKECKIRRVDDLDGWRNTGEADEGSIPANKISASEWTFAIGRASGLMDKMDRLPLKLGDIANRIFQGPITSADRVFLFKEFRSEKTKRLTRVLSQELNEWVELESAILKPVIRSGSIGRYYANPTALVLFPYEVKDCSAQLYIPSELNQEYPLAWKYLNRSKKMLESREQGRFKDSHWYGFGRTQNLGMWEQPKLMIPYMITHLAAYLDKEDNFYFINVTTGGYGITISGSPLGLEYLCGLINSRVLDFYLKQVSTTFHGGYFAANKQYIERLPIRSIDFNKSEDAIIHQSVVELVETMLTLHRRLGVVATVLEKTIIQRQLAENEERINNLVFKLYGLTDGEIKTINKEAG